MRYFVRQSMKGDRCAALSQYYQSTTSDEVFNIISKELDVNGNKCEILDRSFQYENKHRKIIEHAYDSQFKDKRDINQDEKSKHVNDKLTKLPLHKKLQKLNLNDVVMNFDATSLYPSATYDENSVYPKIATGFAFKPHTNYVYVEALIFNRLTKMVMNVRH